MRFLDYPDKPLIFMNFVMVLHVMFALGCGVKGADRITICGTADPQPVADQPITPT